MSRLSRGISIVVAVGSMAGLGACAWVPNAGPTKSQILNAGAQDNSQGIQIVDVTDAVARKLYEERGQTDFATVLGRDAKFRQQFGIGDVIEVSIWEAPPAALFGGGAGDTAAASALGAPSGARVTTLPAQVVDGNGDINVPFVGEIKAAGLTPTQLQGNIRQRLSGMAHDPQVLVRLSKNETSYVTIVGDVTGSTLMPLSARGERLLDALAAAGGVHQPVDKVTLQVTRGDKVASLPLQTVIRDPRQNIPLRAGDVVTALYQPYSFTVLGATGKNQEVSFEAQGITLAQALARSGGLDDNRSDPRGVFVFRLENPDALDWKSQPVHTTADGKVPVIYHVNLRDPGSFFVTQSFMIDNKDLLYVSDAPISDIQKVLNVVFSVAYPVATGVQTFK